MPYKITLIAVGVILLTPFHQVSAQLIICDPLVGICRNPFGNVDQNIQELQLKNQLQGLQQTQSNQATINRLKLQYGYAAYSECMSTSFDYGNQYEVAIHLNAAESCMASYKAKQDAKTQCSAGYVYFNGSCVSGAQGCLDSWGAHSVWTGTGCDCATNYKWDGSKCAAATPTCTANATYNGSQCICNAGYSSLSGYCVSNQRALEALKPRTGQAITPQQVTQVPTCAANATYNGSQCICNTGYFSDSGACITGAQSCINNYGSNSVYNSADNSCDCVSGFVWNSGQTACVKTATTVITPTVKQTTKNNSGSASVLNGVTNAIAQTDNTSGTNATTTFPVVPQKGFWSRLFHALNPFSWF